MHQGGVETRGRKPKDFDPSDNLPQSSIPWKVYDQAFRKLYPHGDRKPAATSDINENDILKPIREQLVRERLASRTRNSISRGSGPYPHLKKGASDIRKKRIVFLAQVSQCIEDLSNRGVRVSTKSVQRELSLKRIEAGTTTTQRAIRQIRLGLPHS